MTSIGDRIDFRLVAMNQNQSWLAQRLDVDPTQVSRWVRDECEPRATQIANIARELNVTSGWLITGVQYGPGEMVELHAGEHHAALTHEEDQ